MTTLVTELFEIKEKYMKNKKFKRKNKKKIQNHEWTKNSNISIIIKKIYIYVVCSLLSNRRTKYLRVNAH